MAQSDNPDKEAQIKANRALSEKLHELQRQLSAHGASINLLAAFNRSFLDWLVDHIKTVDLEMGRFIKP